MSKKKEIWVDSVKLFSCVLIVICHFYQSMRNVGIIPENLIFSWFERTAYMYPAPLFFVCSGYLYQKLSHINTWKSWANNVIKKFIALGVPYFALTTVSWVLKHVFSDSIINEPRGLLESFFLFPEAQYWYLYVLFSFFLLIPTVSGKRSACALMGIATALKFVYELFYNPNIYFISGVMQYSFWFVLGMFACVFDIPRKIADDKRNLYIGFVAAVVFITASFSVHVADVRFPSLDFLLGFVACCSIFMIAIHLCRNANDNHLLGQIVPYTLYIYLLHTIFASGFRGVLLKLGVDSTLLHIPLGLCVSFGCPILVALLAKKIKFIEFFFVPNKYLKISL